MRRRVLVAAAFAALFAAGFALAASNLAVGITEANSSSTGVAFVFTADQPADFTCTLDATTVGPCGTSTTIGSTSYDVPTGTHTFTVEGSAGRLVGAASTTVEQKIGSIVVPPPPVTTTVTVTSTSTSTVTSNRTATSTVAGPTTTVTETSTSTVAWAVVLGVAGGALVAAGVTYWLVRRRRGVTPGTTLEATVDLAAENARWQLQAKDGPPPRTCRTGDRICQKECEAEPALRRVTAVALTAEPDGGGTTVRGETVELLNDARGAQRDGRPRDAAYAVHKASGVLGTEVVSFTAYETEAAEIDISVELEGGDASCTFTLLRCVNKGGDSPWAHERQWTAKAKDSVSVAVGKVAAAPIRGCDGAGQATPQLEALLTAFVTDR